MQFLSPDANYNNRSTSCAAFQGAARAIDTGLEIRLLIFKLFDQYVISNMDELIWSVKPKYTDDERQRLAAMQAELLNKLREGMERLSVAPTERDTSIARLVDTHGHISTD